MDRIARQTRSHFLDVFEAEEDGTSTIEFVVLLPLFIMFMMLVTNTNLLTLRHNTLVGIPRDTVQTVSGPAMTSPEAGTYSEFGTIAGPPPTALDTKGVSGHVAVVVAGHATAPAYLGALGESRIFPVASTVEASR